MLRNNSIPSARLHQRTPSVSPAMHTRPRNKKKHYRVFMFAILLIGVVGGFLWVEDSVRSQPIISPLHQDEVGVQEPIALESTPKKEITIPQSESLTQQVQAVTGQTSGTFGIAVKNLTTGETFTQHADDAFFMASTYKVPLVLTSFIEEEKGMLSKNTMLGYFPLDDGRKLVITRSEEDLAQLLAQAIGWQKVEDTARQLGMVHTTYGNDFTTTPNDMLLLLEKIYTGSGMSGNVRNNMYNLLMQQENNDRLPKYLPKDAIVAHKTGELDNALHDIGIVTIGKTTYIIVLMGKDLGVPEDAREVEAKLSQVFYEHFINP